MGWIGVACVALVVLSPLAALLDEVRPGSGPRRRAVLCAATTVTSVGLAVLWGIAGIFVEKLSRIDIDTPDATVPPRAIAVVVVLAALPPALVIPPAVEAAWRNRAGRARLLAAFAPLGPVVVTGLVVMFFLLLARPDITG